MIKRFFILILIFLLIAYQYGIAIFLISSTNIALSWFLILLFGLVLIFLFSDKFILFGLRPVVIKNRRNISILETTCRYFKLSNVRFFQVKGSSIFIFRSLLGTRYICIGRDLLKKRSDQELSEIYFLGLISSFKNLQKTDQTIFCLLYLLYLPSKLLERIIPHNFLSTIINWLYYPVKTSSLRVLNMEDSESEIEAARFLGFHDRDINYSSKKYNIHNENELFSLVSSKYITRGNEDLMKMSHGQKLATSES